MNALVRWCKFNLVGAMGMVLQLATLAALNRLWPGHYLLATAAALEVTLVHNFVWHVHYTWRDRRDDSAWRFQLMRFHLSNGLVSTLGNLATDALACGRGAFSCARRECDRNSVLLDCEFLHGT